MFACKACPQMLWWLRPAVLVEKAPDEHPITPVCRQHPEHPQPHGGSTTMPRREQPCMVAAGSALNALSLVEPSEQWLLVRQAPEVQPYVQPSAHDFTGGRASPDSTLAGPSGFAAGDGSVVPRMVPGLTVIGNSTAAHRAAVQEGSCRELRAEYAVAQVSSLCRPGRPACSGTGQQTDRVAGWPAFALASRQTDGVAGWLAVAQVSSLTTWQAGMHWHWPAGQLAAQGMLCRCDSIWCALVAGSLAAGGLI